MKTKLIVALDVSTLDQALSLVRSLRAYTSYFKVGLQLIQTEGPLAVLVALKAEGVQVFMDSKFNDIPNTVVEASRPLIQAKVDILNLHLSCPMDALRHVNSIKGTTEVFGVTLLTSFSEGECHALFGASSQDFVLKLAKRAQEAGLDGVICSPREVEGLRKSGISLKIMTPGVRPNWADALDQKRFLTPREAVQLGVDYMVVGRPITQPPQSIGAPVNAIQKILEEMKAG